MHRDEWACAHWLRCKLCQNEREEVKERLEQLKASYVLGLAEKKRRVANLEAGIKQAQCNPNSPQRRHRRLPNIKARNALLEQPHSGSSIYRRCEEGVVIFTIYRGTFTCDSTVIEHCR